MSGKSAQNWLSKPWLPVLLAFLLLGAALWSAWLIRTQIYAANAAQGREKAQMAALANLRQQYESLLALDPCEARERFLAPLKPSGEKAFAPGHAARTAP